jgi:glycerol-3-phosphate responsive antiterminator
MDSMGLESALESVDTQMIDLLDISPALAVPYIVAYLQEVLPLPFIGSGLISTPDQVQSVLQSGALAVAVVRSELWL